MKIRAFNVALFCGTLGSLFASMAVGSYLDDGSGWMLGACLLVGTAVPIGVSGLMLGGWRVAWYRLVGLTVFVGLITAGGVMWWLGADWVPTQYPNAYRHMVTTGIVIAALLIPLVLVCCIWQLGRGWHIQRQRARDRRVAEAVFDMMEKRHRNF